jgi:hypothetical protein
MKRMNRSDQQLVINYFEGDEKSLEILFCRYLKPIYNFTYRYVGDKQNTEHFLDLISIDDDLDNGSEIKLAA